MVPMVPRLALRQCCFVDRLHILWSSSPMIVETVNTANAVRLVLGVARLGEKDLRGWWQGHAMDQTGQYVLAGMFRRTWRSAALELDMAAATMMHNDLLGRPTALHLFSDLLPFRRWTAGWLAEQKTSENVDPLLSALEGWTTETATESIRVWSGQSQASRGEPLGEGLFLGRMTTFELADPPILQQAAQALAAAYLDQAGQLRPPYFDLAR
jgi:hypothetical protein